MTFNDKTLLVEVKSLNGKQFDVRLNIPSILKPIEVEIRNTLNEHLFRGSVECSIFVRSNDSVNPVVKLILLADVVKELNVSPISLNRKVSSVDQPVVFPLDITDSAKKSYKIIQAFTTEGEAQVELDPSGLILQPTKTSHLNLLLKLKPDPNRSFYAGRIRLKTDHPYESEIEIPFLVKVEN